jgi:hypothetical protein
MPTTRIHINQHVIRRNKRNGTDDPPITVKAGRTNTYCRSVEVLGPSRVVYAPLPPALLRGSGLDRDRRPGPSGRGRPATGPLEPRFSRGKQGKTFFGKSI